MINSLYRYQDAILKSELKDSILPKLVNCACSVQLTEPLKAILANSRGELENVCMFVTTHLRLILVANCLVITASDSSTRGRVKNEP